MLHFETERLIIRPFSSSDLEEFLDYRSDPEVAAYQGWQVPYTRAMAEEFITHMSLQAANVPGEWLQLAIVVKESGQFVGDIAYYLLGDDPRQAEIGLTLRRSAWKNGYAQEAGLCLLAYLFEELRLHRVRANCDVENHGAYRTLEKLGLRREAYFVENLWFRDRWSSEYWYAMLDREWPEIKLKAAQEIR